MQAIRVGAADLDVWVADESSERRQGLKGVAQLPEGVDGMLFVFATPSVHGFHMRDTLIALDAWWIDSDGRLIGTAAMEPCLAEPCTSYQPPSDVKWVIETAAGAQRFDLGDMFSIVESG